MRSVDDAQPSPLVEARYLFMLLDPKPCPQFPSEASITRSTEFGSMDLLEAVQVIHVRQVTSSERQESRNPYALQ